MDEETSLRPDELEAACVALGVGDPWIRLRLKRKTREGTQRRQSASLGPPFTQEGSAIAHCHELRVRVAGTPLEEQR